MDLFILDKILIGIFNNMSGQVFFSLCLGLLIITNAITGKKKVKK